MRESVFFILLGFLLAPRASGTAIDEILTAKNPTFWRSPSQKARSFAILSKTCQLQKATRYPPLACYTLLRRNRHGWTHPEARQLDLICARIQARRFSAAEISLLIDKPDLSPSCRNHLKEELSLKLYQAEDSLFAPPPGPDFEIDPPDERL